MDYIGQKKAKEKPEHFIQVAKMRGESLDHTLLYGPPGLGKTTLAGIIAAENGREYPCYERSGNRKSGRFGGFIGQISQRMIFCLLTRSIV